MLEFKDLLHGLPDKLRQELIAEYQGLLTNFYEGRWTPAELHAGRFCEVVYTIVKGRADGAYPSTSSKPEKFDQACRSLENMTQLERGLRILVPRALPPLYEIRNNRGVGHVGGDVNSNYMDASYSIAVASWVVAELIRVFHNLDPASATRAVNQLTEIKVPEIWTAGDVRRVLNTDLKLESQCLLLIASSSLATIADLIRWTEVSNKTYLRRIIQSLHKARKVEAADPDIAITLLPPGAEEVRKLLNR